MLRPLTPPQFALALGLVLMTPLFFVVLLGVVMEERVFVGWYVNDILWVSLLFAAMALVGAITVLTSLWTLLRPRTNKPEQRQNG